MNNKKVGVLGAGTMGVGIAHVFGEYGYDVIAIDKSPQSLAKFDELLEQSYKVQCFLGKPQSDLQTIKQRIQKSTDLQLLKDCDFLIENTTESEESKTKLLEQLNPILKSDCLIVINTSCIPILSLSKAVDHPERMVGIHFMNPVPVKTFVEIIKTNVLSAEALAKAKAMLQSIGKSGNEVNDHPGFVINRVFMVTINEAIKVFEEKLCQTPHQIDELFVKCLGHRMGPLMTADLIGLDTILYSLNVLQAEFNNAMYVPAKLLADLVAAGSLGRKTGIGLYQYDK